MSRLLRKRLKVAIYLVVAVALLWSLTAILLTGPVVVSRLNKVKDLPYDPDVSPERLRRDVEYLCGELAPRRHEPQD